MCVCVCVCVRARMRSYVSACLCLRACDVRVNQCVTPCIDQKRSSNSRLLLNLIPGRPFTMFSISLYDEIRRKEANQIPGRPFTMFSIYLYDDIRRKEASQKEFANSLYLSNTF